MTLPDFQPGWRIGRRSACLTSGALSLVIDVLSDVSLRMRSPRRRVCSASASVPGFAQHLPLHSSVQTACPERAMPAAWRAFAGRQAAPCAAPPGHRIPVPLGRGKMQGKIKGRGTALREKPVCTWGWRGTRQIAAPCRVDSQCVVGTEESVCLARLASTDLDGGAT
jgi:hypothetical protein